MRSRSLTTKCVWASHLFSTKRMWTSLIFERMGMHCPQPGLCVLCETFVVFVSKKEFYHKEHQAKPTKAAKKRFYIFSDHRFRTPIGILIFGPNSINV